MKEINKQNEIVINEGQALDLLEMMRWLERTSQENFTRDLKTYSDQIDYENSL